MEQQVQLELRLQLDQQLVLVEQQLQLGRYQHQQSCCSLHMVQQLEPKPWSRIHS